MRTRILLAAALAATLTSGCALTPAVGGPGALAIENITLVDGTGAPPRAGVTVVIVDGHIAAVGANPRLRRGTERHDLAGHFVLPGLVDMHAHIAFGPVDTFVDDGVPVMRMRYDDAASRTFARQLLQWGITTVRNPAGPTREAVALRDALNAGELAGPRAFTAGAVIDQSRFDGLAVAVTTPAAVAAEVARQVEAGVDMVKLYATLTPPMISVGIDAAHARGVPAIAHLWLTDWRQAAEMGIDGIVHALPMSHTLLPPDRAHVYRQGITGTQAMYQWFEYADLGGPEMQATYAALAANRVHLDPTLVAVESMFFGDDPRVLDNPALGEVPEVMLENWRGGFSLTAGWSDGDYRRAAAVFPRVLELTRRLHEAGVMLTAGTDLAMPWLAPGTSLHRELELLVAAGIPPLEVISIATRNAADALGALDEFGTVEPGKRADLVVLDADPLADIRNTRRIVSVFQRGVEVRRD